MPVEYEKIRVIQKENTALGETEESHPAFGQIIINRISSSGSHKLYGSALDQHPSSIRLTIRTSNRMHNLARDWFFGRKDLIEIELSASQFADMLTHMNMGDGVPCTIRRYNGKQIPWIPEEDKREAERIQDDFKEGLEEKLCNIKEAIGDLDTILEKKSINKKDKHEIRKIASLVERFMLDSAPFIAKSFGKATQKITTQAKKEVESFISMVAQETGLETLRQMSPKEQQERMLPGKKEKK